MIKFLKDWASGAFTLAVGIGATYGIFYAVENGFGYIIAYAVAAVLLVVVPWFVGASSRL